MEYIAADDVSAARHESVPGMKPGQLHQAAYQNLAVVNIQCVLFHGFVPLSLFSVAHISL